MKKQIIAAALSLAAVTAANAGGMLTNTNQNVAFLRNPARDAAIDIDGVYSNPAGVAFLNDGIHLSVNWQAAFQTREIESTSPLFRYNLADPSTTKKYKGDAVAPFVPSVQAAYNKNNWSFQFGFSVHGGGGKCTFDEGIGTFDNALGNIVSGLGSFGATGYRANSYMQGKQYYFGFTLGAAYKVNEHLSFYGGLRALYGMASYKATIKNIQVGTAAGDVPFDQFLNGAQSNVKAGLDGIASIEAAAAAAGGIENLPEAIQTQYAALKPQQPLLMGAQPQLNALQKYSAGVDLMSDQSAFGIAPIIGMDYKIGNFNFAVKYEFRTRMSMKNESTLIEAGILEPLKKFEDGTSVREDNPAALALGVQYSPVEKVRINAGYHHFYDLNAERYNNENTLLDGGTNEYLGGVEVDVTDKLTVSGGAQITRYGNTDAFMNDISFVVNSWSFGVGVKYQVSKKVAVNAAYFQTNYGDYTQGSDPVKNVFTRTNKCGGIGVDFAF